MVRCYGGWEAGTSETLESAGVGQGEVFCSRPVT